jgi:hypothetical protein
MLPELGVANRNAEEEVATPVLAEVLDAGAAPRDRLVGAVNIDRDVDQIEEDGRHRLHHRLANVLYGEVDIPMGAPHAQPEWMRVFKR